jgi:peroxiredoxin
MLRKFLRLAGLLLSVHGTVALGAEVAPSAEEVRPLLVGSAVPDVSVQTIEGTSIRLPEALVGKPTVLFFYRGGWCPYCNTQLSELRDVDTQLRELGVQMVGLSGDAPERLRPTLEKQQAGLTLLSDVDLYAAKAFGLAFQVSDDYVAKLEKYEIDTTGNSVSSTQVLPVPAVFVVDTEGIITFSYVNPNYRVRCNPEVLLAAARAVVSKP